MPVEVRAWRRVIPLRRRRISSTLCIPSGFFLNRNWSRCRPREDEVKDCWQYWHFRSLTDWPFAAGVWPWLSSPPIEPSGVSTSAGREEGASSMFHNSHEVKDLNAGASLRDAWLSVKCGMTGYAVRVLRLNHDLVCLSHTKTCRIKASTKRSRDFYRNTWWLSWRVGKGGRNGESGRGNDGSCSVLPSFYRPVEIIHNLSIHNTFLFAFVGITL